MSDQEEHQERVRATVELFRLACKEHGYGLSGDDRVDEKSAAMLLGYKQVSLKNLRSGAGPSYFNRGVGGGSRISYRLSDLANWIELTREENPLIRTK